MEVTIPWNQLRRIPQESVDVGMAIVAPSAFQTYRAHPDGTVVGMSWTPCTGRVWIVTEVGQGTVKAKDGNSGEEITGEIRPGRHTLIRI